MFGKSAYLDGLKLWTWGDGEGLDLKRHVGRWYEVGSISGRIPSRPPRAGLLSEGREKFTDFIWMRNQFRIFLKSILSQDLFVASKPWWSVVWIVGDNTAVE